MLLKANRFPYTLWLWLALCVCGLVSAGSAHERPADSPLPATLETKAPSTFGTQYELYTPSCFSNLLAAGSYSDQLLLPPDALSGSYLQALLHALKSVPLKPSLLLPSLEQLPEPLLTPLSQDETPAFTALASLRNLQRPNPQKVFHTDEDDPGQIARALQTERLMYELATSELLNSQTKIMGQEAHKREVNPTFNAFLLILLLFTAVAVGIVLFKRHHKNKKKQKPTLNARLKVERPPPPSAPPSPEPKQRARATPSRSRRRRTHNPNSFRAEVRSLGRKLLRALGLRSSSRRRRTKRRQHS